MKADSADCFGIGEDACLKGFVLAGGGHQRSPMGACHGAHSRSDSAHSLLRAQPGLPSASTGEFLEQAVQELAVSDELLGQDQTFQKLGCEVGTVGPADGAKLGIEEGQFELVGITKRLKHWSRELRGQVDFAMGSVIEPKEEIMFGGDLG